MMQESLPSQVQEWAVAHTKSRCEKVLAAFFDRHLVACFLPLVRHRKVYRSHVRESWIPLFPGYLFFDRHAISYHKVFDSRKAAQVLYAPEPETLKRALAGIARAMDSGCDLREIVPPKKGARVVVTAGPLQGLEGEIVRQSGKSRFVIRIEFLAKAADLEIDEAFVAPV